MQTILEGATAGIRAAPAIWARVTRLPRLDRVASCDTAAVSLSGARDDPLTQLNVAQVWRRRNIDLNGLMIAVIVAVLVRWYLSG